MKMNKLFLCEGLSRRGFLTGLGAFGLLGRKAFAAPHGAFSNGEPNLRFALMSDVHISMKIKDGKWHNDATKFIHALKWFRDKKIDAVVIAGDLANYGMIEELEVMAEAWEKVFPGGKAPDGRKVEKVFVTGNHDWEGPIYSGGFSKQLYPDPIVRKEKEFYVNRAKAWEKLFGEKYEPIYLKTVRGYTFIGQHWDPKAWKGCGFFGLVKKFTEERAAELSGARPFFYVQHPPLKATCNGPKAWGQDVGIATKALSEFPNAVAFSGHTHYTLTDETSIWQDAFTAVNASSLWYTGKPELFQPESPRIQLHATTQGALVEVYDDRIVIVRRQFMPDETLAEDWVVPLPVKENKPYKLSNRIGKSPSPQFPLGSAVSAVLAGGALKLKFPQALGEPQARVFKYEVTVESEGAETRSHEFMDPRFNKAPSQKDAEENVQLMVRAKSLPPGEKYRVSVTPCDSLGNKGKAISSEWILRKKKISKS